MARLLMTGIFAIASNVPRLLAAESTRIGDLPALAAYMITLEEAFAQGPDFQSLRIQDDVLPPGERLPKEAVAIDTGFILQHLESLEADALRWCDLPTSTKLRRLRGEAMAELDYLLAERSFVSYTERVERRDEVGMITYYVADDYNLVIEDIQSR